MSKCGIYGLIDPNNKILRYIGKSTDISRRYREHCRLCNCKTNTYKDRWLRKLLNNKQIPELIILMECQPQDLDENEIKLIDENKSPLLTNGTKGGTGGDNGSGPSRRKPIYRKDLSTGEIVYFEKIAAAVTNETPATKIVACCKKRRYTCNNYMFWYANEEEPKPSHLYTHENKTMTISEWAKYFQYNPETFRSNVNKHGFEKSIEILKEKSTKISFT